MSLSIIVPVFEDRERCLRLLPHLTGYGEVIVVDASRCDPLRKEEMPSGSVLLSSERASRGHQMNVGAEYAQGEVLLFLHADTRPSPEGLSALEQAMNEADIVGGGFMRRFDSSSLLLRATCWLADWRGRLFGWFLGDQAIFARRSTFTELGGFREMRAFEDYDLCRRLREKGRMHFVEAPVLSSARRFEGEVLSRILKDALLTLRYLIFGCREFLRE